MWHIFLSPYIIFLQELHSVSGEREVPGPAAGLQAGPGQGPQWEGAPQAAGQEEEERERCEEMWHGVLRCCYQVREIKVRQRSDKLTKKDRRKDHLLWMKHLRNAFTSHSLVLFRFWLTHSHHDGSKTICLMSFSLIKYSCFTNGNSQFWVCQLRLADWVRQSCWCWQP